MNWRKKRKVFKIVRQRFAAGDFSKLPWKYERVVDSLVNSCLISSYDTHFRPMFYENFGKWDTEQFMKAVQESTDRGLKRFEQLTGITRQDWQRYFKTHYEHKVRRK